MVQIDSTDEDEDGGLLSPEEESTVWSLRSDEDDLRWLKDSTPRSGRLKAGRAVGKPPPSRSGGGGKSRSGGGGKRTQTSTRGGRHTESPNVSPLPRPSVEEETALSRAASTSSALIAAGFWRKPQDLYRDSIYLYLLFEMPSDQDAPTRDMQDVESRGLVQLALAGKWPGRDERAAPPSAEIQAYFARIKAETWRAPRGASPSSGEVGGVAMELSLPPPPAAVSGHVARVNGLNVKADNSPLDSTPRGGRLTAGRTVGSPPSSRSGGGGKPASNSTQGGRHTESPNVSPLPRPLVEEEAALSRAASTSSALIAAGFWRKPQDLYRDSIYLYLLFEMPSDQDATTRDMQDVESRGLVQIALAGKWPGRDERAAPPSAEIQASFARIKAETWRAPRGASPSSGEVGGVAMELSLPPPPAAVSGHVARVNGLNVKADNSPLDATPRSWRLAAFGTVGPPPSSRSGGRGKPASNSTRGGRHTESHNIDNTVSSPLPGPLVEEETALSRAASTSSALVTAGFWRAPRDLYRDSMYLYLLFEMPAAQDAPTRDGQDVESGIIVQLALAGKGPGREERADLPSAEVHASFARTKAETWRAPRGASPSSGEVGGVAMELSLPPPSASMSGHVARVNGFNVKAANSPLMSNLAAFALALFVLVCRHRFLEKRRGVAVRRRLRVFAGAVCGVQASRRRNVAMRSYHEQKNAAVILHALGRGVVARRRLRLRAQVVCGIQARRRGRVALSEYHQKKNAAVILHALGRGGLVRRRRLRLLEQLVCVQACWRGRVSLRCYHQQKRVFVLVHALARGFLVRRRRVHLLEQVVRVQTRRRGRVSLRCYRKKNNAAVVLHALARGGLVRRRRLRLVAQVVGFQSRRRGRVAECRYRQQRRSFVVLHALARGVLARLRVRRSRAATAAAMAAIASCDAVRQCANSPESEKGDAGPVPLDKERGAPGQASGQNISPSPASSTTISGSKARLTKTKAAVATGAHLTAAVPQVGDDQPSGRRALGQQIGSSIASSTPNPGAGETPKKGKKTSRSLKRDAKRQADKAVKIRLGMQTAKGGSPAKTESQRPQGASTVTRVLGTVLESRKGTAGSTNSGPYLLSTPIGTADNMARSGCGTSGAAGGSVRGSGVLGFPTPRRAYSRTNSLVGSGCNAAPSTSGKACSISSKATGSRHAGVSSSGRRPPTMSSTAGAQRTRGDGQGSSSWSPSETPACPAGLFNKKNRCGINVAVHVLRNNAELRKALIGVGGEPPDRQTLGAYLGTTFKIMERGGKCFVHPSLVTKIIDTLGDRQLDAPELVMYLVNTLRDEADETGNVTMMAALKAMVGNTHYVCRCSCSRETRNEDPWNLLTVPMKELPLADADSQSERGSKKIAGKEHGVSVHLNSLLSEVFSTQMVTACDDCRKDSGGKSIPDGRSRSAVLADSPDRLMLQLGRFSGDAFAERKKLAYLVTVPTALDVGSHTEAGRASGGEVMYDLDTVVHHTSRDHQHGDVEAQKGHYKVYTRISDDTWCRCDDENVSTVHASAVLTEDAFILSYAKRT